MRLIDSAGLVESVIGEAATVTGSSGSVFCYSLITGSLIRDHCTLNLAYVFFYSIYLVISNYISLLPWLHTEDPLVDGCHNTQLEMENKPLTKVNKYDIVIKCHFILICHLQM